MKTFKQFFLGEQDIPDKDVNFRTVALVPGSFKPPHKGHFEMFKNYADKADRVIVVISDPQNPKSIRTTDSGKYIPADTAKKIFEIYAENENVRNITFLTDPGPVKFVYDYFAERTQPGDKVILGVGGKGEDAARYKNAAKYAPEGVEFDIDVFSTVGGDTPLSASDIRNKLDNLSVEDLLPYIPENIKKEYWYFYLGMHGNYSLLKIDKNTKDEYEELKKYFKFCFVRNPWSHALSYYFHWLHIDKFPKLDIKVQKKDWENFKWFLEEYYEPQDL
mgnify:CR=1 FL=1